KWEEKQFPIDDLQRQEMIRMLDKAPRRRIGLFWWFGSIGALVTIAAVVIWSKTSDTISQPSMTFSQDLHDVPSIPIFNNEDLDSTHIQHKEIAPNTSEIVKGEPTKTSLSSIKKSTSASSLPGEQQSITQPNNLKKSSSSKVTQPKQNSSTVKGETVNPDRVEANSPVSSKAIDKSVIINQASNNPSVVATTEQTEPVNVEAATEVIVEMNNISEQQIPIEIVAVRNSEICSPIDDIFFSAIPIETRNDNHTNATAIVKRHPVAIFGETSLAHVASPTPLVASGLSFRAGAGMSYGVSSKIQLSLTAGYMLQKDGFEFQRSSTAQHAGFGARSDFHTLTPDQLHFVYGKVGIHYRAHRHIFSIFGGAQFLYGAKGNIVIQTDDQLQGESETSKYAWLKLDGMQRWLWNGEASYGYQLTPRLSVHAGLRYYFSSLRMDDPALDAEGYYWKGKLSDASPFLTINYHLYGKR
ncbi:MAG: hypothetical protein M3Q80_02815, partial [bacterium]|nr:hypothetical protein [bacterium]